MIKNPFSVFDFFGYVFPGAFALMAVFYFVKMEPLNFTDPMSLGEVIATAKGWLMVSESIVSCSVFLILSYIVGHLVAYFKKETVEHNLYCCTFSSFMNKLAESLGKNLPDNVRRSLKKLSYGAMIQNDES